MALNSGAMTMVLCSSSTLVQKTPSDTAGDQRGGLQHLQAPFKHTMPSTKTVATIHIRNCHTLAAGLWCHGGASAGGDATVGGVATVVKTGRGMTELENDLLWCRRYLSFQWALETIRAF